MTTRLGPSCATSGRKFGAKYSPNFSQVENDICLCPLPQNGGEEIGLYTVPAVEGIGKEISYKVRGNIVRQLTCKIEIVSSYPNPPPAGQNKYTTANATISPSGFRDNRYKKTTTPTQIISIQFSVGVDNLDLLCCALFMFNIGREIVSETVGKSLRALFLSLYPHVAR
jgi:hypothetical protein